MAAALLDSDTLSEICKGRHQLIAERAEAYLSQHGAFAFSLITRYEILRGLMAKRADKQVAAFHRRCAASHVLPPTDEIVVRAAEIYADLRMRGELIGDADILIGATALVHGLTLVTNNLDHFTRIRSLIVVSWATP